MKIRTPYEQAEKAGKQLLAKATEEHIKRKEDGKKSTYQAAKEAATFLVNQDRGKVMIFSGSTYCCFECMNHRTDIKVRGKPICVICQNGSYFQKKGNN